MISFVPEFKGLKQFENKISKRKLHKYFKNSLMAVMRYWHSDILPKHFTAQQKALYPNAFLGIKKEGILMVDTGRFRNHIMSQDNMTATFRKVTRIYRFGRPATAERNVKNLDIAKDIKTMSEQSKKRIFAYMKGKNFTFKEAQRSILTKIYRKNVYSAKTRALFVSGISAMNKKDIQEMNNFMNHFMIREIKNG